MPAPQPPPPRRGKAPPRTAFPPLHLNAAEGAAAVPTSAPGALVALMAGRLLQDGETVILLIKPSRWLIVFASGPFAAGVTIVTLLLRVIGEQMPRYHTLAFVEAAVFLIFLRLMWAILQWMGRLYVLTDMRILRLSGVFTIEVFDCPLRKIARTYLTMSLRDRLLNIGSIEIVPADESHPAAAWQTVAHPLEVHVQVVAAIRKAKSSS